MKWVVIIVALILFLIVGFAHATTTLAYQGQINNSESWDMAVSSDGYIYAGEGSEVNVYDGTSDAKLSALYWNKSIKTTPIGSWITSMEISGDYLYVSSKQNVTIVDISTRTNPVISSQSRCPAASSGRYCYGIDVNGNYAYVTVPYEGIYPIDVTDKAAPSFGTVFWSGESGGTKSNYFIDSYGDRLYSNLYTQIKLQEYDITDKMHPTFLCQTIVHDGPPGPNVSYPTYPYEEGSYGIKAMNGYTYLGASYLGFHIFNTSTPGAMWQQGYVNGSFGHAACSALDINAKGIDVDPTQTYLYTNSRYYGPMSFNIANKSGPYRIGGSCTAAGYSQGAKLVGDKLYLSMNAYGWFVYNVATPATPVQMGWVPVIGDVGSMGAINNTVIIGDRDNGAWAIDISNKNAPTRANLTNIDGYGGGRWTSTTITNNTLYMSGCWGGFHILDITHSNDVLPELGKITSSGIPRDEVHQDDGASSTLVDYPYAYASMQSGMTRGRVYDISNPADPYIIWNDTTRLWPSGTFFAKLDTNMLISRGVSNVSGLGISLWDITNRSQPTLAYRYWNGSTFTRPIFYEGTKIAVMFGPTDSYNHMYIYDWTDPSSPVLLNHTAIGTGSTVYDAVKGNNSLYVYLTPATGKLTLREYDISNPYFPVYKGGIAAGFAGVDYAAPRLLYTNGTVVFGSQSGYPTMFYSTSPVGGSPLLPDVCELYIGGT